MREAIHSEQNPMVVVANRAIFKIIKFTYHNLNLSTSYCFLCSNLYLAKECLQHNALNLIGYNQMFNETEFTFLLPDDLRD